MILKRAIFTVAALALLIMPLTANVAGLTINGHTYADETASLNYLVTTAAISITGDSCLNLTDVPTVAPHYVISGTTNYASINGYVLSGRNAGTWNGPGITSDMVAADAGKKGLAAMTAAEYIAMFPAATFHGVNVSASAALVQYDWLGDSNLSGTVDTSDLSKVKNAVLYQNSNPGSGGLYTTWLTGDANYSGSVDTSDLSFVKNAVLYQNSNGNYTLIPTGNPGSGSADGFAPAPVPEPSTFVLVFLATACFLGFRKFST